jgi:hypothetical protein
MEASTAAACRGLRRKRPMRRVQRGRSSTAARRGILNPTFVTRDRAAYSANFLLVVIATLSPHPLPSSLRNGCAVIAGGARSCAPRRMGRAPPAGPHSSRLAEDGEHLRMTAVCVANGASRNDDYLFRPSIGVIATFASSMPSMQLTLSATTSVPSGLLPRANTSTPQSMQS